MPAKLVDRPVRPTPNYIRKALHPDRPELYNAKRLIDTSRGLPSHLVQKFYANPSDPAWKTMVSPDVAAFIEDRQLVGLKMTPSEERKLLTNPPKFFSKPQNVPVALRKQVYFPDFTVTMRRNKYLGPWYAQFYVPTNFSKLDFKDYLKQAYGVDVVGIQSYLTHAKVRRHRNESRSNQHRGELTRMLPRKRMTVKLAKPFLWPTDPKTLKDPAFDKKEYTSTVKGQKEIQKKYQDILGVRLDKKHRQAVAEQAKDMILNKARWAPTWSQIPENRKLLLGQDVKLSETTALARNQRQTYADRAEAIARVDTDAQKRDQLTT